MKKTKVIIPALGILLLSTAASVTGTVAWFSANSTVQANGMKVKATTSESLVIRDQTPVQTATSVSFTSDATTLSPATHDSNYTTYTTGLKFVENTETVNASTGVAADPEYDDAINLAPNTYYVDYVAYIASAGQAMSGKTVTFNFDSATQTYVSGLATDGSKDTEKAFSVDIYMESVAASNAALGISAANYVGTIAFKNNASDSAKKSGQAIPQNGTQSSYLRVIFRVYLDGDLEKTTGQKYVYTDKVDVTEVNFGIAINVAPDPVNP